jgi:dipeptidyl aminopeptidase/acylaminoacyl peptidase
MSDTPEPPWSSRYRWPSFALPTWARDQPDKLLYTSNISGATQLFRYDMHAGRRWQVTQAVGGTSVGAVSPDGTAVWWFGDDHGNEHGRWHITSNGGEGTVAGDAGNAAGIALGRDMAVIGLATAHESRVSIWRPDGTERVVFRESSRCTVNGLSADDALICVSHQRGTDARHPSLTVLGPDGVAVASRHDRGPGRLWPGEWSPAFGDRRLIVHHERGDRRRPAIWSPESDSWQEVDVDLPGDVWASWYPAGDMLLLRHEVKGRSELYRWDANSVTRLPTPTGHINDARVHPSGQLWVDHSASDRPPQLLGTPHKLTLERERTVPVARRNAPYRDVRAGDVGGFIALPPLDAAAPPGIMLMHGGPAVHDVDDFSPEVQAWVDHGFAVVLVNYSGSTGQGRHWRESIRSEPGPGLRELDDIAAVRTRIVGDGMVDPTRIIVAGRSWGGYLALLAAGRQPELRSLGIATMPVADWVATYEDELPATQEHDRALFGGSPAELPDFYAERSPITFVDRIKIPLLLIASRNDPHCPQRQIDNYVRRLAESGKAFEVFDCTVGHAARRVADRIAIQAVQLEFARRHLMTPPPDSIRRKCV